MFIHFLDNFVDTRVLHLRDKAFAIGLIRFKPSIFYISIWAYLKTLGTDYAAQGREHHFDTGLARAIDVIVRQTNLSRDMAAKKLENNNMNVLATIYEEAGPKEAKKDEKDERTLNQRMYAEYRTFLDDASRRHTVEKEEGERRSSYALAAREENAEKIPGCLCCGLGGGGYQKPNE